MKRMLALASGLAWSASLFAVDIENGEDLHFEDCTGCHQEEVYTRENRVVESLERLRLQVRFCKDTVGAQWFDEDVEDVTEFLNRNYYHFD